MEHLGHIILRMRFDNLSYVIHKADLLFYLNTVKLQNIFNKTKMFIYL